MDRRGTFSDAKSQYDKLLQEASEKNQVDLPLLQKLIDFEATKVHMRRRRGAKDSIRKMIEDWLEEARP
jgi:hypothetical protein